MDIFTDNKIYDIEFFKDFMIKHGISTNSIHLNIATKCFNESSISRSLYIYLFLKYINYDENQALSRMFGNALYHIFAYNYNTLKSKEQNPYNDKFWFQEQYFDASVNLKKI